MKIGCGMRITDAVTCGRDGFLCYTCLVVDAQTTDPSAIIEHTADDHLIYSGLVAWTHYGDIVRVTGVHHDGAVSVIYISRYGEGPASPLDCLAAPVWPQHLVVASGGDSAWDSYVEVCAQVYESTQPEEHRHVTIGQVLADRLLPMTEV